MTIVFIGGSRDVSRLNEQVRRRIDVIVDKGFPIVIGDANGADKAVQAYLADKCYRNVEIFCSANSCRNNVAKWHVHSIPVKSRTKTAEFYSEKDRAMAKKATVGFMLWDGRSVGTLMNVFRLLTLGKKSVLYVVPEKKFLEFHDFTDWNRLMEACGSDLRAKIAKREAAETPETMTALAH